MDASSSYWKICRISPKSETVGYEYYLVPTAQAFLNKNFLNLQEKEKLKLSHLSNLPNGSIQAALLSYFHSPNASVDVTSRARAGFCLRCDVSYPILKACQKIDILFGENKSFTYQDLLPFILNDDGQTPIILDKDGKTQLILDDQGKTKTTAYKFFTVEVLRTFKPNSNSMNLDNWAYLQTKQNQDIKDFLSEFGFKNRSDWGLLNRVRSKQLERLSQRDRYLV